MNILKEARLKLGLTQKEFAVKIGYHKMSVSRYENDRAPIPTHLKLLCEGFIKDAKKKA